MSEKKIFCIESDCFKCAYYAHQSRARHATEQANFPPRSDPSIDGTPLGYNRRCCHHHIPIVVLSRHLKLQTGVEKKSRYQVHDGGGIKDDNDDDDNESVEDMANQGAKVNACCRVLEQ